MHKIKFEEMPQQIQAIFKSEQSKCLCRVRIARSGAEEYYVTLNRETSVFNYVDGKWTCVRTY